MLKSILLTGLDDLENIGDKIFPSWQDVVVQLLATFILVFIIAKFLYKPAKQFIQKRKDYIDNNLNEASNKNAEASKKLLESEQTLKEARKLSKDMIDEAKITALNEKDKIVLETNEEIKQQRLKAKQDLENEKIKLKQELENEVIDVAILAASKIVNREIKKEDNEKIIHDFLKEDKS